MADPVAEKSAFLCMYMSSHPDTLVAYAKWFGKVKEPITGAQMTGITTKVRRKISSCEEGTERMLQNINLSCTLKDGSKKEVVVPIEPPLKGYDDVKPRLLEMKALAQEGLGMIKAPKIDTFIFPWRRVLRISLFITPAYILYLTPSDTSSHQLLQPVALARQYIGEKPIALAFWFTIVAHVLESVYTASICCKHSMPFLVGLQYVGATLIWGAPIWITLRKTIQSARIDSVMKIE
ncbi:hypothetical protein NMY22_g4561 [Coprinellus aureogranulatus]|nr:hypothetical protein NMY22_g4561 [Coprinellus aureogranulatus]